VRAAIAAAFLALVFHTELYADFLEDPFAWTLLGIGLALVYRHRDLVRTGSDGPTDAARSAAHPYSGVV
jgi:hypothetical protein